LLASTLFDIKQAYEEHDLAGLREMRRQKPCIKNRVAPEIEEGVLQLAYEYPAYGQLRVSNELHKRGILLSGGGVRSIWQRNNLETIVLRIIYILSLCFGDWKILLLPRINKFKTRTNRFER